MWKYSATFNWSFLPPVLLKRLRLRFSTFLTMNLLLLLLLLLFTFSILDHSIQKREKSQRTDFVGEFKHGSFKHRTSFMPNVQSQEPWQITNHCQLTWKCITTIKASDTLEHQPRSDQYLTHAHKTSIQNVKCCIKMLSNTMFITAVCVHILN